MGLGSGGKLKWVEILLTLIELGIMYEIAGGSMRDNQVPHKQKLGERGKAIGE